jgi:hypothetical protein
MDAEGTELHWDTRSGGGNVLTDRADRQSARLHGNASASRRMVYFGGSESSRSDGSLFLGVGFQGSHTKSKVWGWDAEALRFHGSYSIFYGGPEDLRQWSVHALMDLYADLAV